MPNATEQAHHLTRRTSRGDSVFAGVAWVTGLGVAALVTGVGVFLTVSAIPALRANTANFLADNVWHVSGTSIAFGIPQLLWVTAATAAIALIIATPVSLGVALFVTHYAPTRLRGVFSGVIDILAAVPSIVYGLWGALLVLHHVTGIQQFLETYLGWIPLLSANGAVTTGSIFLAGLVLAVMITPIITAVSREVFTQVPSSHLEGALALGATRWEMIRMTVLPFGRPGMIAAAMLGLGRALGETIAVSLILSTTAGFSWSLFAGGETFSAKIANNAAEFDTPTKTGAYIAAGLVLFIVTFAVNAAARAVIHRRKD